MSEQVYLNGEYVDYADAKVSVEDRGFQFADGIYEVVQVVDGQLFAMDPHLDRLAEGAEIMQIPVPISRDEFWRVARRLIQVNGVDEGCIYIQLTRGAAPRIHSFPDEIEPTLVVIARNLRVVTPGAKKRGGKIITAPDNRWGLCYVKTVGLVPNIMVRQKAKEAGAIEAVMVRDGLVTEGSHSNCFIVKDGEIWTHPLANILPGITRELAIEVARKEGLTVHEKAFSLDFMLEADEVFLTGTLTGVMPVVAVDDVTVGDGTPGPVTQQVSDAYDRLLEESLGK